ncbi:MAG TPA: hypothetical protein VMU50_12805 [Polyangia bacterium]|nr:hypothetical protein [Polyangia bacterium]
MRLLKLAVLALVGLAAAGHWWQQARRLKIIRALPGPKARDYFETTRARDEWMMVVVAALFGAGAIAAVVYVFAWPALRGGG